MLKSLSLEPKSYIKLRLIVAAVFSWDLMLVSCKSQAQWSSHAQISLVIAALFSIFTTPSTYFPPFESYSWSRLKRKEGFYKKKSNDNRPLLLFVNQHELHEQFGNGRLAVHNSFSVDKRAQVTQKWLILRWFIKQQWTYIQWVGREH